MFSLWIPDGWVLREMPGRKYKVAFGRPTGNFAPNINIVDESFSGPLDSYVDANLNVMPQMYERLGYRNFSVLRREAFTTATKQYGVRVVRAGVILHGIRANLRAQKTIMTMEFHLYVAGALQIGLAILHLSFPKRFEWKEELSRLSLLNRQMFLVHTIFVCFVILMTGALSLFAPQALLHPTPLSRLVLGGFAAFWGLRLLFQWLVYDMSLWKGDSFKTFMQAVFTLIWIYLTSVYAAILFFQN
jgi:hypothetical protein